MTVLGCTAGYTEIKLSYNQKTISRVGLLTLLCCVSSTDVYKKPRISVGLQTRVNLRQRIRPNAVHLFSGISDMMTSRTLLNLRPAQQSTTQRSIRFMCRLTKTSARLRPSGLNST